MRRIFLLFPALLAVALTAGIVRSSQKKAALEAARRQAPSQPVQTLDGQAVQLSAWLRGAPGIAVFIDPDCGHCQYEVQALLESAARPAGVRLAFLSGVAPDSLRQFAAPFAPDSNAVFLHDPQYRLHRQLGVSSYPTILLYDAEGQLTETLQGEVKPDYLFKRLRHEH